MIRLTGSNKLQVVLSGAATASRVTVSYLDFTPTATTGDTQLSATNGATPVDICDAPPASTTRQVDYIGLHAEAAMTATISLNDGTARTLTVATLSANDTLEYTHSDGWRTKDANGSLKFSINNVTGNLTVGGTLNVTGATTVSDDLAVNGGDLTSTATTFNLLNATVTTLNLGGAATTVAIGAATGTCTIANATVTLNGTTANIGNTVSGALHLLTVGNVSESTGAALRLLGYSGGNRNWQIGIGDITGSLTITPSTAVGGATFTTPEITVASGSTTLAGTLAVTGAITGGGYSGGAISGTTGAFSNTVTVQAGGAVSITRTGSTTSESFDSFVNTGGSLRVGIASNVGSIDGVLAMGNYAAVIGTTNATQLTLMTNSAIAMTLASGGAVTIPGLAGVGSRNVVVDANGLMSAP